ncbi:unnamed protein product [Linum tenue]|uniref:50S ribosomal protein L35 n=1 Tax=Linum tenue TaxID=586396 RepID=A0AAV0L8K3_9ROSI|nr:unnamed protein product [Linum tenue]
MLRICTKLRSLAAQSSNRSQLFLPSSSRGLILPPSPLISCKGQPLHSTAASTAWSLCGQLLNASKSSPKLPSQFVSSPYSLVGFRGVSSRERKKRRKPMTPVTSKVKKIKMKGYSSFKDRFRPLNDGTIRRWHEGKRHNAHLKSSKAKRRLRKPAIVPAAYAKVMKKLNFCT